MLLLGIYRGLKRKLKVKKEYRIQYSFRRENENNLNEMILCLITCITDVATALSSSVIFVTFLAYVTF
jgi:hypothetical protein